MKVAAAFLVALALVVCHVAADDLSSSPVSIESVISSLPTQSERERWKTYSAEERKSPMEAKLAEKMKNISANCRQLQSRLVEGKPLSDYPGLLTLGSIIWVDYAKEYSLKVQAPIHRGEGDYAGFTCTFDQSFNIVRTSTAIYTF